MPSLQAGDRRDLQRKGKVMFFNGFTLLLMLASGATSFWIGNRFGYDRGRADLIKQTDYFAEARRKFFETLSLQMAAQSQPYKKQKEQGL